MAVSFGDVVLDLDAMQVRRAGEVVPVEPQVFDVLAHLVRNRDRLVPRIELLDEVWGDRFVSDSALSSRIKSARRAIGDNGRDQRLIRTVHGRGFRFVGEVIDGLPPPIGVEHDITTTRRVQGSSLLAELDEVVADLLAGRGASVQVVGTSASARAAALDHLADEAGAAGLLVGRGGATVTHHSGGPVLDALDEWVQLRPDLYEQLPAPCRDELHAVFAGGAASTRQRLLVAARELAVAAAGSGAVLVVDDLHLIDRPTQELAAHIARATRRHRLVVVVSHRADFDLGQGWRTVTVADAEGPKPVLEDLPDPIRAELRSLAMLGPVLHESELVAALDGDVDRAARLLDLSIGSGLLERDGSVCRWRDAGVWTDGSVAPTAASTARRVADALITSDGDDTRIAELLRIAGDSERAPRHELAAARSAADAQDHRGVLELTSRAQEVQDAAVRSQLFALRGDAAWAIGDSRAIRWYREALRTAATDEAPWLRARLTRAHLMAGDVDAAKETFTGVEPDGGPHDGTILLIGGMLAYFCDDMDTAQEAVDAARTMALAPGAPAQLLDVIALDGMIAHSNGQWFDRLRRELRAADSAELAGVVFDSHVCAAQYLLYGPTGHDEVKELARSLRHAAEAAGSRRAAGFACTLLGEAALLSGDLDEARSALTESVELHQDLRAETGTAHALQRLAEVDLAEGDRATAERRCRHALPMARWSPLSRHLLQRTYGTLIAAAPTPEVAVDVVDEATEALDEPDACEYCQIMVAVPAAIACAAAARLEDAAEHLERARRCADRWDGPAWPAAVSEAAAALALAEGRDDDARRDLLVAAAGFQQAGQPLDEERCREAIDDL